MDLEVDEGPLFEAIARIAKILNAAETDPEAARQMLVDIRHEANDGLMLRQANYTAALAKLSA